MKMYKKSELSIVDNLIVTKDMEVVAVDDSVIWQANRLETMLQQAKFIAAQPDATPAPSLDGFERKSVDDDVKGVFNAHTPMLDRKAAETMAIMDELDDASTASKANELLSSFKELLKFVRSEYVMDRGICHEVFDTPLLGSPLEMTEETIVNAVAEICGMEPEGSDGDDDLPSHGAIAVPFTRENLDRITQFFDELAEANEADEADETSALTSEMLPSKSVITGNYMKDKIDPLDDVRDYVNGDTKE